MRFGVCDIRKQLLNEWEQASKDLSAAALKLYEAPSKPDFENALREIEEARLRMNNAVFALELHSQEHGCG